MGKIQNMITAMNSNTYEKNLKSEAFYNIVRDAINEKKPNLLEVAVAPIFLFPPILSTKKDFDKLPKLYEEHLYL